MREVRIMLLTCAVLWLAFLAVEAREHPTDPPVFSDEFVVVQEAPYGYGAPNDGIQFFALQRLRSRAVDRAVLSIDANLPLADVLRRAKNGKIRITIDAAQEPQELKR